MHEEYKHDVIHVWASDTLEGAVTGSNRSYLSVKNVVKLFHSYPVTDTAVSVTYMYIQTSMLLILHWLLLQSLVSANISHCSGSSDECAAASKALSFHD